MTRLRFGSIGVAALAAALGATEVGAVEAPDASRPLLGDLMLLTQFRQDKLWYAERAGNWPLAAYEAGQLKRTLERVTTLYPKAADVSQDTLIREKTDPAVADLDRAIAARDKAAFVSAYGRVIVACNQCHAQAGLGFIAVRVPTRSPFTNQLFEPQP